MERDQIKTDLSALFMPRQPPITAEETVSYYRFMRRCQIVKVKDVILCNDVVHCLI